MFFQQIKYLWVLHSLNLGKRVRLKSLNCGCGWNFWLFSILIINQRAISDTWSNTYLRCRNWHRYRSGFVYPFVDNIIHIQIKLKVLRDPRGKRRPLKIVTTRTETNIVTRSYKGWYTFSLLFHSVKLFKVYHGRTYLWYLSDLLDTFVC